MRAEGRRKIRVGGLVLHVEAMERGQLAQQRVRVGEGRSAGIAVQRRHLRADEDAGQQGRVNRLQLARVHAEPEIRGRLHAEDARSESHLVQIALEDGVAVVTTGDFRGDDVAVARLGGCADALVVDAQRSQSLRNGLGFSRRAAEEVADQAWQVEVAAAIELRFLRADDGGDQPG